jgi:hypothetical protein
MPGELQRKAIDESFRYGLNGESPIRISDRKELAMDRRESDPEGFRFHPRQLRNVIRQSAISIGNVSFMNRIKDGIDSIVLRCCVCTVFHCSLCVCFRIMSQRREGGNKVEPLRG